MSGRTSEKHSLMHAVFRLRRADFSLMFSQLTRAEFFVLEYVHKHMVMHPETKGVYVSELAQTLHISSPAVSRTLRPLEGRRLIERHVDCDDRRTTYLTLTNGGERTRQETNARIARISDTFIADMGLDDIRTLTRLLNQFTDIWKEQQEKENNRC